MTKSNPKEKDVKAGVKKILDKHGWFWWSPPANQYGRSGISDIQAIKAGVFLSIEVKLDADKNPPTELQKGFLISIQSEDGYGFVVDAERLPVLDAFLTAFGATARHVAKGNTLVSQSDNELMINCIRTLGWEVA